MTAVTTTEQAAATPRTAIEKLLNDPASLARFVPFLPVGTDPRRVIASVDLACMDNPKLKECTPVSLVRSVAKISQWGLEIGSTAYLVPFGKNRKVGDEWVKEYEAVPIADYRGLIEMAVRTGCARSVEVGVVREGEHFEELRGSETRLTHIPSAPSSAKIVKASAVVRLRYQDFDWVTMSREEIESLRAKSMSNNDESLAKAKKPTGLENNTWYATKSCVRRVLNLVPKNAKLAALLNDVDRAEAGEFEVIPSDQRALPAADCGRRAPTPLRANATPHDPYEIDVPEGVDPATGEDFTP